MVRPCKQVSQHFEDLAEELGDKVRVVKLNIDDNPMTAGRFGVRGLPTFMIFQDGKGDSDAPWRHEQEPYGRVAEGIGAGRRVAGRTTTSTTRLIQGNVLWLCPK